MATYEQRDNSGSLFPNDKKGDNEKAPNLKGEGKYVCPHCGESSGLWLSGWTRTTAKGLKWLSLSLQPKEQQAKARRAEPEPTRKPARKEPDIFEDDQIPF